MEMQTAECEGCQHKQSLISKYLNLIDLLKKKNDRSTNSGSLHKKSLDTVRTNQQQSSLSKAALPYYLARIVVERQAEAFDCLLEGKQNKRVKKGYVFISRLENLIRRRLQLASQKVKESIPLTATRLQQTKPESSEKIPQSGKKVIERGPNRQPWRQIFSLTCQLSALQTQNKVWQQKMEDMRRRQQIESKKKQDSLEMLAEQMGQKNEVIMELQNVLRGYEQREGCTDIKVLQLDSFALRRELQKQQKVNDKLNFELERKAQQIQSQAQDILQSKETIKQLQSQKLSLQRQNSQMTELITTMQRQKKHYDHINQFLELKMVSLRKHEKSLVHSIRGSQSHKSETDEEAFANLQNGKLQEALPSLFESQYKVEKILNYIYNIEAEDTWVSDQQGLFDQEQLSVLNQLKIKFMNLARQTKELGEQVQCFRQQKAASPPRKQSTPQRQSVSDEMEASRGDQTPRRGENGLTMRLLGLQLEKSKQVEKISQLKNTMFHIRSMVMNLIRSLEPKAVTPESRDIIDVCCELFEFSEEEKDAIFQPKNSPKKFLGLW